VRGLWLDDGMNTINGHYVIECAECGHLHFDTDLDVDGGDVVECPLAAEHIYITDTPPPHRLPADIVVTYPLPVLRPGLRLVAT
jgi:hypothetical protein